MAYKDKDKQREANRQAKMRQREREGMTITLDNVIPKLETPAVTGLTKTKFKRGKDYKTAEELAPGEYNRVSKPGDADYVPQCETTRAFVEGRDKRPSTAKRGLDITPSIENVENGAIIRTAAQENPEPIVTFGKSKRGLDIKYFEDLPPDVQETIRSVSDSNEEFQRRTQIAITYQHTFPDRYNSMMASIVVAGSTGVT